MPNPLLLAFVCLPARILLEQPGAELDAQNTPDCIVQPGLRDGAAFDISDGVLIQRFPVFRHHQNIDAGVKGRSTVLVAAARQLAMTIPVADHNAIKPQPVFQYVSQQILVAVHFLTLPAVKGRHNSLHTGFNSTEITLRMQPHQFGFTEAVIALIFACVCAAITQIMFSGGDAGFW